MSLHISTKIAYKYLRHSLWADMIVVQFFWLWYIILLDLSRSSITSPWTSQTVAKWTYNRKLVVWSRFPHKALYLSIWTWAEATIKSHIKSQLMHASFRVGVDLWLSLRILIRALWLASKHMQLCIHHLKICILWQNIYVVKAYPLCVKLFSKIGKPSIVIKGPKDYMFPPLTTLWMAPHLLLHSKSRHDCTTEHHNVYQPPPSLSLSGAMEEFCTGTWQCNCL